MAGSKMCPACQEEFDWTGVLQANEEYCCQGCASGGECTCPQHHHGSGEGNATLEYAHSQPIGREITSPDDVPETP